MTSRVCSKPFKKDEPPLVSACDWRLQAATGVTQPVVVNGHEYPIGTAMVMSGQTRVGPSAPIIDFGVPSVAALLLDHAARLDIAAHDFSGRPILLAEKINEHNFGLFEFFESRMASVVYSSCALDAFSNEVISRSYAAGFRYIATLKDGISVSYDLESVERKLSLDEKLARVIPAAYSIPTPKGKRPWGNFKKLKRLRDRIVHCKVRDRAASRPDDDVLWRALLEPSAA